MPDFLTFQEISKKQLDPNLVGGKASALAQLYQKGFSVPDGFVITTNFFDRFLEKNGIAISSKDITSTLKPAKFPDETIKTIHRYIDECSQEGFVAVRSSASIEDADEQSFAGQFDTFLGVRRENVLEAIKKCWQSLYSSRVQRYAQDKNNTGKMAVIIQDMINPEISGVAFSTHPVTGDPNSMVIEAVLGSNELLVQGSITPDCYIVSKNFEILDKKILPQKEIQIIDKRNGNLNRTPIDEDRQKLSDHQILDVARMVNDVKNIFNKPVDIEWAIEDKKLYILQSRPITAIHYI